MIYQVSKKNMEKIKDALNEEGAFVRRFRKENIEELVDVYNFPPSTILLYGDQNPHKRYILEIKSKYLVSKLHVQSQLEEMTGIKKLKEIKLEEITKNGN